MKQKKRYILLRLEKSIELGSFFDTKLISNQNGHAIISCHLDKLSEVVLAIEKDYKIITISGTLKSLRSSV